MRQQLVVLLLVLSLATVGCAPQVANQGPGGQQKEEIAEEDDGFPWFWVGVGAVVLAGAAAGLLYIALNGAAENVGSAGFDPGPDGPSVPALGNDS